MTDVPKGVQAAARQLWDMLQRVAMRIAGEPPEQRDVAFAIAERSLRQMAKEMRIPDANIDDFVIRQMELLRQFVTEIDVGGSPRGGRA
jgi:hypothetical protein